MLFLLIKNGAFLIANTVDSMHLSVVTVIHVRSSDPDGQDMLLEDS